MALHLADLDGFVEETREASPANLLLKIESFSMLKKYGIDKYESKPFEAGGYTWKLIIYPDGYDIENGGCHVSAYLSVVETSSLPTDWEFNALFTFFLYNHISDNYLCFRGRSCRFHAISPIWGSSQLISKETLNDPYNRYLVEDKCVLGAEVFVIKSQRVIERLSLLKCTKPSVQRWVIYDFDYYWTCTDFRSGGHTWRIELQPSIVDGVISIYLVLVGPGHKKVRVDGCFRIKDNVRVTYQRSQKFGGWFEASKAMEYIYIYMIGQIAK